MMIRHLLIVLVLTLSSTSKIWTQKSYSIAIYTGMTSNNLSTYQFDDFTIGYSIGTDFILEFNKKSALGIGLTYHKRDYDLDDNTSNLYAELNYKSSQIHVPLVYTHTIKEKWGFSIGLYTSFSFNKSLKYALFKKDNSFDSGYSHSALVQFPVNDGLFADLINDWDPLEQFNSGTLLGAHFGIAYNFKRGYSLGLEFARDFTKFYHNRNKVSVLWYRYELPDFPNDERFEIDETLLNSYGTFFTLKFEKRFSL